MVRIRCPKAAVVSLSILVASLSSAGAAAGPACDPAAAERDATDIGRLLDHQARLARLWNTGWAVGFGLAAAGQLTFALEPGWAPLVSVDGDMRKGLYVGAAKASLGVGGRLLFPLRVERAPAGLADPCLARDAALRALRISARRQRRSFWLNHIGSLAVNAGGALLLGLGYGAWRTAALSFAVGYPVGLVSIYTMPRGAWHRARRFEEPSSLAQRIRVIPRVTPTYRGAALALRF